MALFGLGREVMYALLVHTGMYLILSEPYNCDKVRKRLPVYKNAVYRTMINHSPAQDQCTEIEQIYHVS